jgi:hypothetical protein
MVFIMTLDDLDVVILYFLEIDILILNIAFTHHIFNNFRISLGHKYSVISSKVTKLYISILVYFLIKFIKKIIWMRI